CGVCTAKNRDRSTVAPSTSRNVSVTGTTGTTASAPVASAAHTACHTSGCGTGRAASCTTTWVAFSGTASSPARTDAERESPPDTTAVASGSASAARSAGTTSTTPALTSDAA